MCDLSHRGADAVQWYTLSATKITLADDTEQWQLQSASMPLRRSSTGTQQLVDWVQQQDVPAGHYYISAAVQKQAGVGICSKMYQVGSCNDKPFVITDGLFSGSCIPLQGACFVWLTVLTIQ